MSTLKTVKETLEQTLVQLESGELCDKIAQGRLPADLHEYYNQVGLRQGWLKPEYATPLSEQGKVTQIKNVDSARDVVQYWLSVADMIEQVTEARDTLKGRYSDIAGGAVGGAIEMMLFVTEPVDIVDAMKRCVDYEANRGYRFLESGSESQHEQWRTFVETHQKDRITPGHKDFRKDNYDQWNKKYSQLTGKEQDQDRLFVAVATDRILERAVEGYKRMIDL